MRQTERNRFRLFERSALGGSQRAGCGMDGARSSEEDLVEEAVEVDVECTAVAFFEEDVLAVAIAEATPLLAARS